MTKTLILFLCYVALFRSTTSWTDQEDMEAIDTFIGDIMTSENMIGVGVSVVKDGRPLMAEGYGIMDINEGGDVTNRTLWYLASCSKALNAALISKVLSEDGRYTFDTPVRDIYPDFTLETGFRSEHTTIRDLISHRTGTVDSLFQILAGAMESREDYISRSQYLPALHPFRDSEGYNNAMVTIGGRVVELLTGVTWEEALKEHVLDPLGMTQTTFVDRLTPEEYAIMATAHENDDGVPRGVSKEVFGPNLGPATPSGGLVTSAEDMQKWLMFIANMGLAEDGSRVMNESDIMRTMTETSIAKYPPANENPMEPIVYSETGVALGWYNGLYRGFNMAAHGGFFFGFQSKVTVLPELGMGVYVNINCQDGYTNGSVLYRVSSFVLDTLLGVESQMKANELTQNVPNQPSMANPFTTWAENDIPSLPPRKDIPHAQKFEYTGTYGHLVLGNLSVFYNETDDLLWGIWGTLGLVEFVGEGDNFLGLVQEPLWFTPPLTIFFSSSDGQVYDEVLIPFLMPQAPPTFIRDLTMSDAPPPPIGSCEDPPI